MRPGEEVMIVRRADSPLHSSQHSPMQWAITQKAAAPRQSWMGSGGRPPW
jgi:hypothetical protein